MVMRDASALLVLCGLCRRVDDVDESVSVVTAFSRVPEVTTGILGSKSVDEAAALVDVALEELSVSLEDVPSTPSVRVAV